MPSHFRAKEKPEDIHEHVGDVQVVVKPGAAPLTQNESNLCQPSLYGNRGRAGGALLDTSASSCYGLMRLQKVAHLLHRLDPEVFGLSPGIDRDFGLRCQRRDVHGDHRGLPA